MQVQLYDTTLRDGAQREGVSFSVTDKLHIVQKLDALGIHFIEGGYPGSNTKDAEFFARAKGLNLKNARLVAFGNTRRAKIMAEHDDNIQALVNAGVGVVTLVGKSSAPQVIHVLKTTPEENLSMVADSVRFIKSKGLTVIFDAEHFFDGYKVDAVYALKVLEAAASAGADCLVLCDTNGGSLPDDITGSIKAVKKATGTPLGIHAHNDGELAVANTLAAVKNGVTQVQGTINGYGERCGNANLCSIIPDLKLKMNIDCVNDKQLTTLSDVARFVSEAANLAMDSHLPFVGSSAFSHKGGLHVDAIRKWEDAYQHIDPAKVGNHLRVTVSELAGKGTIIFKAEQMGLSLSTQTKDAQRLLEQIKKLESQGFQYENAEASFELLVHRAKDNYRLPFELVDFMVVTEKKRRTSTIKAGNESLSEAIVKVKVGNEIMHTAAEGDGPVNALDQGLRKALIRFYPNLAQVKLTDYKVRILEESGGTASGVRVLIESSDGVEEWHTVGSSTNIIEASWLALADSLEYWLIKHR